MTAQKQTKIGQGFALFCKYAKKKVQNYGQGWGLGQVQGYV